MSELSIGKELVRISSSDNVDVTELKLKYAELINEIEQFKSKNPMAAAMAQTELVNSMYWAVKALTS